MQNYDDYCGDYSNDVFMHLAYAQANKQRTRLKGYYYCREHGEFIRAAGLKEAKCPFCQKVCQRQMTVDSVMEQTIHEIWKDCGIFSAIRADLKTDRKEEGAA